MSRSIVALTAVGAVLAAVVPAVIWFTGNPSFSHRLPVRVPAQAQVVTFDHGRAVRPLPAVKPLAIVTPLAAGLSAGTATAGPRPSRSSSATASSDSGAAGDNRRGRATPDPTPDRTRGRAPSGQGVQHGPSAVEATSGHDGQDRSGPGDRSDPDGADDSGGESGRHSGRRTHGDDSGDQGGRKGGH